MLAPPRGKTGCPAPQKAGLAPPRPVKLTKPAGRSGAKLNADSMNDSFRYAYKLCIRRRKSRKIFSFDFVYRLWLSYSQKYPFEVKGYNVFLYQNIRMHYQYPNNTLCTFVEFLDQSIYALFRPAPSRPAPRIFTFAPPRGFSSSPRPAPLEKAPPRPSLVTINALWGSWKMGWKVVNFDKLFLRWFSSQICEILHKAVWTPQK